MRAGGCRNGEAGAGALALVPHGQLKPLLPAPGQLGGFDASGILNLTA